MSEKNYTIYECDNCKRKINDVEESTKGWVSVKGIISDRYNPIPVIVVHELFGYFGGDCFCSVDCFAEYLKNKCHD